MCLAHGPQRSDTGEALTRYPSVSSQALYLGIVENVNNCMFETIFQSLLA